MTADRILSIAQSYIGVTETQTNNVTFNTAYYGREVNGSSYAWCAVFIWYCFMEAGASDLYYGGKKTAYCPTLMSYYKGKGQLHQTPKVGDIVFYNFSGKKTAVHVGIVSEVGDGWIKAIEGNTSSVNQSNGGMVMERKRALSVCLGFARPDYTEGSVSNVGTKTVTATSLNVRTGAGTEHSLASCFPKGLPKGTVIVTDKEVSGWQRLKGTTWYVSASYLK